MRRDKGESWRDAVARIAGSYGLEVECLNDYDRALEAGYSEENAAWSALYDWDVLALYVDGKPAPAEPEEEGYCEVCKGPCQGH